MMGGSTDGARVASRRLTHSSSRNAAGQDQRRQGCEGWDGRRQLGLGAPGADGTWQALHCAASIRQGPGPGERPPHWLLHAVVHRVHCQLVGAAAPWVAGWQRGCTKGARSGGARSARRGSPAPARQHHQAGCKFRTQLSPAALACCHLGLQLAEAVECRAGRPWERGALSRRACPCQPSRLWLPPLQVLRQVQCIQASAVVIAIKHWVVVAANPADPAAKLLALARLQERLLGELAWAAAH